MIKAFDLSGYFGNNPQVIYKEKLGFLSLVTAYVYLKDKSPHNKEKLGFLSLVTAYVYLKDKSPHSVKHSIELVTENETEKIYRIINAVVKINKPQEQETPLLEICTRNTWNNWRAKKSLERITSMKLVEAGRNV